MLNTVARSWDGGGLGDNRGLAVTVECGHGVCAMFFTSFNITNQLESYVQSGILDYCYYTGHG